MSPWLNAAIPSHQRGMASDAAIGKAAGKAFDYLNTHTPEQAGADIAGAVSKAWSRLEADHARAAAQGPEAEARWIGQVVGRTGFEIASFAVPVTKLGLVGKLADGAADLARLSGVAADLGKLREVLSGSLKIAREVVLDTKFATAARGKLQATLTSLRKIDVQSLGVAEQRALREAKASIEDALEISAPRDPLIGNPAAIAKGFGTLSKGQQELLEMLPERGEPIIVGKSEVSMTDIAALTAHTGQEFAIFTNGSRRMVLRGNKTSITLDAGLVNQLKSEGWRWSAHTQPGLEARHAIASASDQNVLKALGQEQSMILNSRGERNVFTQNDISLIKPK